MIQGSKHSFPWTISTVSILLKIPLDQSTNTQRWLWAITSKGAILFKKTWVSLKTSEWSKRRICVTAWRVNQIRKEQLKWLIQVISRCLRLPTNKGLRLKVVHLQISRELTQCQGRERMLLDTRQKTNSLAQQIHLREMITLQAMMKATFSHQPTQGARNLMWALWILTKTTNSSSLGILTNPRKLKKAGKLLRTNCFLQTEEKTLAAEMEHLKI